MHRKLGQTEINVSLIGLGTVKFGRNQALKYPTIDELPSDAEILNLLQQTFDMGINLLDTAPAYGKSEERLGLCLKKMGNRHDWIIASKCGENFKDGISSFDFSKNALIESVDNSLKVLHTDYLDIMLIHSNGDDVKIIKNDEVFETLSDLKKTGKIRAFGMSTKTIEGGKLALQYSDVAMVTYNPIETKEKTVIAYAHQLKKGILIKKALASGHIDKISQFENPVKKSITFILKEEGVHSIVIGTLHAHHLKEIINYASEFKATR